jgi:ubiquinone/menaquinone biosynthesis C-methylase UbiE
MSQSHVVTVAVLFSLVVASQTTAAQDHAGRDAWQRVGDVLVAMAAEEGSIVADLGAGGGYFTTRLAKAVGTTGRVFAVDINPAALKRIEELTEREGLENVSLVQGTTSDPSLPAGTLDAILIVNAYHEMTEYRVLLPRLLAALKPAGRLVIIDNQPLTPYVGTGQRQAHPYLSIDLAISQLQDAGFEIVRQEGAFTHMPAGDITQWLLVGRRATRAGGGR